MENSFQTSFIPKKPINAIEQANKSPISLFKILTLVLLISMGIGSGALYLYKNYLITQKQVLSDSLQKISDSFEEKTIDKLALFDRRASASKQILASHIVLSPLFNLLGTLTIPQVQYTKFDHQTNEKGFFVKMSGVSRDYRSIALQADIFNGLKNHSFKNVIFSNLVKDKSGNVSFDIEFSVDPGLLSYEKNSLLEKIQPQNPNSFPVNNQSQ